MRKKGRKKEKREGEGKRRKGKREARKKGKGKNGEEKRRENCGGKVKMEWGKGMKMSRRPFFVFVTFETTKICLECTKMEIFLGNFLTLPTFDCTPGYTPVSYSSNWITLLLLCISAPLALCCDWFECGSRQVKRDLVDLVAGFMA